MAGRKGKLTLEGYNDFFNSDKQSGLTVGQLNQIISMHGFRKLKCAKKTILEAVNAIELFNPSRSMLKDDDNNNISNSKVCMKLEDLIADLEELNWQECCVTSVKTLNSSSPSPEDNSSAHNKSNHTNAESQHYHYEHVFASSQLTAFGSDNGNCFHGQDYLSSSSHAPGNDDDDDGSHARKLKPKRRALQANDARDRTSDYASPLALASWDTQFP